MAMSKQPKRMISESRMRLKNQYAHLNEQGSFDAVSENKILSANEDISNFDDKSKSAQKRKSPQKENPLPLAIRTSNKVSQARWKLQNPYAYLDDVGGYGVSLDTTGHKIMKRSGPVSYAPEPALTNRQRKYSDDEIEQIVRQLQLSMWDKRTEICDNTASDDPVALLQPENALEFIGYQVRLEESLTEYTNYGGELEVAGIIDTYNREVYISRQFPPHIRNFTAAHELGHALLHHHPGMHRDRPLDGKPRPQTRDRMEWEADRSATHFLMPRKQMIQEFAARFRTIPLKVTGSTIESEAQDKNQSDNLRKYSRILANIESYNGLQFMSLSKRFGVSTEAIAIRLEELNLLEM